MRVKLEIWMGLGRELGEDFSSPSQLRSEMDVDVQEDVSVRALFSRLADRYPPIRERIFNGQGGDFYPNIVVAFNDRIISHREAYDKILKDGDKIRVMPVHTGG